MKIDNNNYSIVEVLNMLDRKELIVNRQYQRSSGIWPDGPSAYFIDTILEDYPFPKIYMYEYLDVGNRRTRKEIVDGQQRIGTIQRFHNNELRLVGEGKHQGKRFADLDEELQTEFLSYSVAVDVIRNASSSEILQMFRRMNAYTMPLNAAEKRHSSFLGLFKWFVNELSDDLNEFFIEFGVFKERQILRMADAAFIADCILAIERGIVSTNASDLNKLYRMYDEEFDESNQYTHIISETFKFIMENFADLRNTHMMKPYALHSLFTALVHARFGIDAIKNDIGMESIGIFATDARRAEEQLMEMAQAHEAKEEEGAFAKYVWGCMSTTDRKVRRTARVKSILNALGV